MIIKQVINLEYEAREHNKALLLRGTDLTSATAFDKNQPQKKMIIGSTRRDSSSVKDIILAVENNYSISFGNSLFAGVIHDPGACAYFYMAGYLSRLGYGLLIDKSDYVQNGKGDLFYIPALKPIASIFGVGGMFHPRTRVAVSEYANQSHLIRGLTISNVTDPAHIIVFEGDPIKHEEKFLKFVAENGHIIQTGNTKNLTLEEKNAISKITESQQDAAQYHQAVRVLGTKTLQRLYRAGSKEIPGISDLELLFILENGPTPNQFEKLQNGLNEMLHSKKLEPVTQDLLKVSAQELYNKIIGTRLESWTKDKMSGLENLSSQECMQILKTIQSLMSDKNEIQRYKLVIEKMALPLLQKSINDLDIQPQSIDVLQGLLENKLITTKEAFLFLEKGMNSSKADIRLSVMKSINFLIKNRLISIEQALPFLEKGISDSDLNNQKSVMEFIESLITDKLITADQALPLLQKGINSSKSNIRSSVMRSINFLIKNRLISIEQALPFLEKGISDSDFNNQRSVMEFIEFLITDKLITADQALPLLQKGISGGSNIYIQDKTVEILQAFLEKKLINIDEAVPLLEKIMDNTNKEETLKFLSRETILRIRLSVMKIIDFLIQDKLITSKQALPFLKEGLNDWESEIRSLAMESINKLNNDKLISVDQFNKLLEKTNPFFSSKDRISLEQMLRTAKANEPFVTRVKRGLGLLKGTPVAAMRHNPSDLTKLGFERAGITPEQVRQQELDFKQRLAEHPDFRIHPIQPIDLEQQRDQILERQQQMPYETYRSTDVSAGIGAAGKMSMEQQQRRLMQQKRGLRLPRINELGRAAVKSAREAIRP